MVGNIIRHLKIYTKLSKFMAIYGLEYKVSMAFEIFVETGYSILNMLVFIIVFSVSDTFVGWTRPEAIMLICIINIASEAVVGLFYVYSAKQIPEEIANGRLDLILTKPINSQFYFSFGRIYFTSVLVMILWIFIAVGVYIYNGFDFQILNFLGFLITLIAGFMSVYSFTLFLVSFCFKFLKATRLPTLGVNMFMDFGSYPHQIYKGVFSRFFTVIVPVTAFASLPTWYLLRGTDWSGVLLSVIVAIILFALGSFAWNYFIKRYSSASS